MKCVIIMLGQYTYSIQKWYNNKTIESYQYGVEYYEFSIAYSTRTEPNFIICFFDRAIMLITYR